MLRLLCCVQMRPWHARAAHQRYLQVIYTKAPLFRAALVNMAKGAWTSRAMYL